MKKIFIGIVWSIFFISVIAALAGCSTPMKAHELTSAEQVPHQMTPDDEKLLESAGGNQDDGSNGSDDVIETKQVELKTWEI